MKYIIQLFMIFIITFLGEILHEFIPLPIPASIYGLLLMLICLKTKIVKLEQVKDVGNLLLDIMPIMFMPAAVGLITIWRDVAYVAVPIIVIALLTTVFVMAATGKVTDLVLKKNGRADI